MYIKRYISQDVDNSTYTSLFKFVSSDPNQIEHKGEIISLITVSGSEGFLGDKAVKFIWDSIRDSYLLASTGSIVEDVKKGINAGVKKLADLLKHDKDLEGKGVDLSFAVCVFKSGNAYFGIFGEQELYLFKNYSFVNVGEILRENKAGVASIAFSESDYVLLGTKETISKFAKDNNGEDIVDAFDAYGTQLQEENAIVIVSRREFPATQNIEEEVISEAVLPVEDDETDVRVNTAEIENDQDIEEKEVPVSENVVEDLPDTQDSVELPLVEEEVNTISQYRKERTPGSKLNFSETASKIIVSLKAFFVKVKNSLKGVLPFADKVGGFFVGISDKLFSKSKDKIGVSFGRKVWYRKLMARLSALKLGGGRSTTGMKIDGYKDGLLRNRRVALSIGLILVLIIGFWGYKLSIKAKEAREVHKLATAVFTIAQKDMEEAEKSVNFDRDATQNYVFEIKDELTKLNGKKLSIEDDKKFNDLNKRLNTVEDTLFSRVGLSEDSKNIDLYMETVTTFGDGSKPTDIAIVKDNFQNEYLYLVDKGLKSVYKINIDDKSTVKVGDKSSLLSSPTYADVGETGIYVYDSDKGVLKSTYDSNLNNRDFVTLPGLEKEDIGNDDIGEITVLTSQDNIYLLSRTQKAILKSARSGSGYGLPGVYISNGAFENAQDFFADVAIYVLGNDPANNLQRYVYSYRTAKFQNSKISIVNVLPELGGIIAGYTGATTDNYLYVFDQNEKRLISLEKPKEVSGDILHPNELWLNKQYVYRGSRTDVFKDIADIVVDSQEKYAYILDATKIWRVTLK